MLPTEQKAHSDVSVKSCSHFHLVRVIFITEQLFTSMDFYRKGKCRREVKKKKQQQHKPSVVCNL